MSTYDVIVIGGGPNGLTTASWLAKSGRKVLLLERRAVLGGLAASEEFHPGYRSNGLLPDTTGVSRSVADKLGLGSHGLKWRAAAPNVWGITADGNAVCVGGTAEETARDLEASAPEDAAHYLEFRRFLRRVRPVLEAFREKDPIDLVDLESASMLDLARRALQVRRLGRSDMMELLRIPPMAADDWLGEWFENDLLKATLALPAVAGTYSGPRSPGSSFPLLMQASTAGPGVQGGATAVVAALEACARAQGVEIRTDATVSRIQTTGSGFTVILGGGAEELVATKVAGSCDPKRLLLDLLEPGSLPFRFESRLRTYRMRGTTAQVLLAVTCPVHFPAAGDAEVECVRTAASTTAIEQAFDAVKYRRRSSHPVLEVHVPTVGVPDLAPEGHSVVTALVHFAPHPLEPAWDAPERERLGDEVAEILEHRVPGLAAASVARAVLAPPDLEGLYGVTGGHIHHGEHALDQLLVRPTAGCVGGRTPVPGLFLAGSGIHPGGGLTLLPGAVAARTIAAS